jgi:hypothetical protein
MFVLKNLVSKLFSSYFINTDSYQDVNSKGLNLRYNEMLADDLDVNAIALISALQDNTINPDTVLTKYFYYLEQSLGKVIFLKNDVALRRKVMKYAIEINSIRGTKLSYQLLFRLYANLTCTFEVLPIVFGFDRWTDTTSSFDDNHTFDNEEDNVSLYNLSLTGTATITIDFIKTVYRIIRYFEPINAKLNELRYNGELLLENVVTFNVDANGDLNYDNSFNPSIKFKLLPNGDLVATGTDAERYSIDSNGDMIFS